MSNLYQIIAQIQKELYCPICGKNYEIGEIRLRGLFDHTVIIQTTCENDHTTLFLTDYNQKQNMALRSSDVDSIREHLKNFDGDFAKLWSS